MQKDFDAWNKRKKEVDESQEAPFAFPKEGEVWISIIGINVGVEQNGDENNFSRPVLVIKKFNNQMFWVAPLSTKQKNLDFYFNYSDPDNQKLSVVLAQMRLVSIKRLKRDIYILPADIFYQIKQKLRLFL